MILLQPAPDAIAEAAARLLAGGVIALPTDTVYGVAAALDQPEALRRVFALKGRPAAKPLPVLLSSIEALAQVAPPVDTRVRSLLTAYWPGPLTVIVPGLSGLPAEVTGPGGTVGVRVPDHPLALALIERCGGALAVTSANRSGQPPATEAIGAATVLGTTLDLVLDGGTAPGGVPSTVIAVKGDTISVVRDGAITRGEVLAAWRRLTSTGEEQG